MSWDRPTCDQNDAAAVTTKSQQKKRKGSSGGCGENSTPPKEAEAVKRTKVAGAGAGANDLGKMKVAELKDALRGHNLPVTGLKDALVKRLQEWLDADADADTKSIAGASTRKSGSNSSTVKPPSQSKRPFSEGSEAVSTAVPKKARPEPETSSAPKAEADADAADADSADDAADADADADVGTDARSPWSTMVTDDGKGGGKVIAWGSQ